MTEKKVAVVLSGCGVFDGAEIHESVLTLLALNQQGAVYQCFAPDIDQHHVIDHLNGQEKDEHRNVLVESARIARGNIKPLSEFDAGDFDAIMFPGGFGAAKNLSSFAFEGPDCSVNEDVSSAIKSMTEKAKPIGALCISPAVIAKVLDGAQVTIGQDKDTAAAIEAMGGHHEQTRHGQITVDENLNLVTSPCYMLDASISEIAEDASNMVTEVLRRAG